jgi:hypothetical protein
LVSHGESVIASDLFKNNFAPHVIAAPRSPFPLQTQEHHV